MIKKEINNKTQIIQETDKTLGQISINQGFLLLSHYKYIDFKNGSHGIWEKCNHVSSGPCCFPDKICKTVNNTIIGMQCNVSSTYLFFFCLGLCLETIYFLKIKWQFKSNAKC